MIDLLPKVSNISNILYNQVAFKFYCHNFFVIFERNFDFFSIAVTLNEKNRRYHILSTCLLIHRECKIYHGPHSGHNCITAILTFLSFGIAFIFWVWNFWNLKESEMLPRNFKNCKYKSAKLWNWTAILTVLSFGIAFIFWVWNFWKLKESEVLPKNLKNYKYKSAKLWNSSAIFIPFCLVHEQNLSLYTNITVKE